MMDNLLFFIFLFPLLFYIKGYGLINSVKETPGTIPQKKVMGYFCIWKHFFFSRNFAAAMERLEISARFGSVIGSEDNLEPVMSFIWASVYLGLK